MCFSESHGEEGPQADRCLARARSGPTSRRVFFRGAPAGRPAARGRARPALLILLEPKRIPAGELEVAQDQKKFGKLKDDPLSVDGIACIMKYSAEDTQPPLYKDLNDKSYLKDRTNIDPYGMYVVATLQHMKQTKPFPNGTVNRGVKADLKEDYQKGREFTWHGFCSVRSPSFVSESTRRWC
eukprot:COSAG04_NODE_7932_length_1045_cov_0.902748_2_plen_183_part_00